MKIKISIISTTILLFMGLFFSFQVRAGLWDNYSCGDIGGSCEMNSCSSGTTEYNNQYAIDQCGQNNTSTGMDWKCCYTPSSVTCSASNEKCSDSKPEGYKAKSSGDQWCKIEGDGSNCWEEDSGAETECEIGGNTCRADSCLAGETQIGDACNWGDVCCQAGSNANACTSTGGSCTVSGDSKCKTWAPDLDSVCTDSAKPACCKEFSSGEGESEGEMGGIEIPDNTGLPDQKIADILANLLDWILTVFLILALIAFVITGVQYLLAMGSSYGGTVESAKNNFKYAIIAVVIVGASLIIVMSIDAFLNASSVI